MDQHTRMLHIRAQFIHAYVHIKAHIYKTYKAHTHIYKYMFIKHVLAQITRTHTRARAGDANAVRRAKQAMIENGGKATPLLTGTDQAVR